MGRPMNNLVGQRFGRLVVTSFDKVSDTNITYWNTRCDCGNETSKGAHALRRGSTKSCGKCRSKFVAPKFVNITIEGHLVTYILLEGSQRPVRDAE